MSDTRHEKDLDKVTKSKNPQPRDMKVNLFMPNKELIWKMEAEPSHADAIRFIVLSVSLLERPLDMGNTNCSDPVISSSVNGAPIYPHASEDPWSLPPHLFPPGPKADLSAHPDVSTCRQPPPPLLPLPQASDSGSRLVTADP
ncbi:Low-Density Lipoprotein Receptor-Related Protein 3 [Manis pentadactyla]|nr:Low-Density Lipoprotein Receptor-Related Protein 3 [Manis pentadactyla]